MKSEKQRILEAYSEDLKAMYIEGEAENKEADVKKWVTDTPSYVKEKHNIVDAYALLAEEDDYRRNKMAHLNEQILSEKAKNHYKEMMDKHKKDMDHYEECGDMDKYETSKDMYEKAKKDYEDMHESEGLKPAPAPEKHDATGTTDGGDTTNGKVMDKELDKQYHDHMKEADDEDNDDDEHMDEMADGDGHDDDLEPETHDATDTADGGAVTKQTIGYKHMKENKKAYMAYAKKIIGNRDLSKMSDQEKKDLFNKIDAGWNSEDEPGEDGKK
jgi:hypothetical protein